MADMEYRKLPHGGEDISIIGFGTGFNEFPGHETMVKTIRYALDSGINLLDLTPWDARMLGAFGEALRGRREDAYLQMHFGSDYPSGTYERIHGLEKVKKAVQWQMEQVGTDYIDFGFIHCLDDPQVLEDEFSNGTIDYLLKLRDEGVVRHVALSTHTPSIANRILDEGFLDLLMFSINPAYDYQQGQYAFGGTGERAELYTRCMAEGVGISVMKPFSKGQLLDPALSPFGKALTVNQCLQYALDKPGVVSVLPGIKGMDDLHGVLSFLDSTPEERDYSVVRTFSPPDVSGRCVYCNHCQPCPQGINVGLVNKYYDLVLAGDALAADHYMNLSLKAGDCIGCGHCNDVCPFHVDQVARMAEIRDHFGQ